jgi:hemerythrin-like domain-containing protein
MPVQVGQKPDRDFTQPLGMLSDCHRRIEEFLGVLAAISELRGSVMNREQSLALANALRYFREAAPKHTADEEISLFPRLRAVGGVEVEQVLGVVERLQSDHVRADAAHREVAALGAEWLKAGTLPTAEGERLKALIAELKALYGNHIETEDQQVFPLAERVLDAGLQQEIGREMAARRGLRRP